MKRILCSILVGVLACGCTTMNPVLPANGDRTAGLKVGDTISTTARDGRHSLFEIDRMSADEICGAEACVRKSDIVRLEIREISGWRTLLLVGGIVAVAALAAAAAQGAGASAILGAVPK
jgi:hypothetical protein